MLLAAVLVVALICPSLSAAASLSPEQEYNKVKERLSEEKKRLGEARERERSILNELDTVNLKLTNVETDLRKFRKNLKQTEAAIEQVNRETSETRNSMARQQIWIKRKLRAMNRLGYGGDVMIQLLSADNVAQLMRTWKYLNHLTRYEHRIMQAYGENLRKLEENRKKLEILKAELSTSEQKIRAKENELAENKKEKENILHAVRTEKASRQKMIDELNEASRRLLDIIRDSSQTDDYAGKGFTELKGKLIWPAEGKIAIPYGAQKDPRFDTTVFRNGIQIQTAPAADAQAVYAGKVIFAEWFKGFGQLIIINHGSGYHTLYGNLSEIFSNVGDIIKEKQVIGKIGTSGILNAPGVYFEIRFKGKPLDPVQWLKKRK
jgi:septal ring factor EnvC (AmiA/AmiB activator)